MEVFDFILRHLKIFKYVLKRNLLVLLLVSLILNVLIMLLFDFLLCICLLQDVVGLLGQVVQLCLEMVLGNAEVVVGLLHTGWFITDLQVLGVLRVEVLPGLVFFLLQLGDLAVEVLALLLFLLDELSCLHSFSLELLNHLLVLYNLWLESFLLGDSLLVDATDYVFFLDLQLVLLGSLLLPDVGAVVDLFADLVDLVVELLQQRLILGLLALGLLQLEQLDTEFLLEGSRLLHQDLLVLHILNQSFMEFVELMLGLLSTIEK